MTDTPDNHPVEPEGRRRFREALERKTRAARSQQARHESSSKLKGYSGPQGQNRSFRRKAG
ncbi:MULTISPECIES: DUF5302 domain-containing protein [unclassified Streptomyces]|uniref:DUF5302 domain-containing protein n=1 Tax=unclassified Streptomyces TaxID=2593676 RepID=UPI00109E8141|nr:DUF5302 domain-containing protein [Streptomyces sp. A1136]THA54669.1 hypothetical protein E6R62_15970 [Streptomyces sp. A1136]